MMRTGVRACREHLACRQEHDLGLFECDDIDRQCFVRNGGIFLAKHIPRLACPENTRVAPRIDALYLRASAQDKPDVGRRVSHIQHVLSC